MRTTKACRGQGCCPEVSIDGKYLVITDDHGGSIKLTAAEYKEVTSTVHKMLIGMLSSAKDVDSKRSLQELFGDANVI
jgi:hypothetical protein